MSDNYFLNTSEAAWTVRVGSGKDDLVLVPGSTEMKADKKLNPVNVKKFLKGHKAVYFGTKKELNKIRSEKKISASKTKPLVIDLGAFAEASQPVVVQMMGCTEKDIQVVGKGKNQKKVIEIPKTPDMVAKLKVLEEIQGMDLEMVAVKKPVKSGGKPKTEKVKKDENPDPNSNEGKANPDPNKEGK